MISSYQKHTFFKQIHTINSTSR